jgi:hypothetical protein
MMANPFAKRDRRAKGKAKKLIQYEARSPWAQTIANQFQDPKPQP